MKRRDFLGKAAAGGVGLIGVSTIGPHIKLLENQKKRPDKVRKRELLDFDWHFHLGDIKGAQISSFNDHNWRILDLPHDWSIEGKYNKNNPSSWHGAYLPGGIGWYRKELVWDSSWEDSNLFIDFDGIYMNSDVWINGHHLGHWPYGFTSFRYELTPYLKYGVNNIAVRVDNSKQPNARWYTGSGINRHVWLNVLNPVHVDHWGTFIRTTRITKDFAEVKILTKVVNNERRNIDFLVEQSTWNRERRVISHTKDLRIVNAGTSVCINQSLTIHFPALWSPEEPNLYEVETLLKEGSKILDRYYTPLGIRNPEYSSEWGFHLNDQPVMIKGVCDHEDGGGAVGSAIPDDVLFYRLQKLKETGCNAVRTAHNPKRPEFYSYCDLLGLMVLNEAFDSWTEAKRNARYDYALYFKKWWKRDLGNLIKRDRNHPCVIMWSIGNEIRGYTDEWQKKLVDFVHKLDPTRPVTQARGYKGHYIDIAGFNSMGEKRGVIINYHKERTAIPIVGTEMPHTRQTRGVYRTQSRHPNAGKNGNKFPVPNLSKEEVFTGIPLIYSSSYDNDFFSICVRDQYKQNLRLQFLMGSFRWTGFDYLGEANDKWPTRSKDKGVFDLAGIEKDHFYLYQSLWTKAPMVHLLPHWTHPGKEGVKIPIVAYTNCKSVELFFNNESLGEQKIGKDLQLVWQVPYRPGKLTAAAKDENGIILAETSQQTAGQPYKVIITPDKNTIRANKRDVVRIEITIADKMGIHVPDDDHLVYFDIKGPGMLIGIDNGNISDLNPTKHINKRKVFKGKCVGLVQSIDVKGEIIITIHSENLKAGVLHILSL